jgi:hypothetical protein
MTIFEAKQYDPAKERRKAQAHHHRIRHRTGDRSGHFWVAVPTLAL